MGAGALHHHAQHLWVLQHGAGAEVVAVEGLMAVIGHEQRRLKGLQQGLFTDVGVRVMDEGAGLYVAVGVDVEIVAPACDAAAYVLAVVLEVDGEDRLCGAVLPDLVVHARPLCGIREQVWYGLVPHRHVVEEPGELGPAVYQVVDEGLGADGVDILGRVAAGGAKGQAMPLQDLHGPHDGLIGAGAAAAVRGFLEALHTDGGDEVLHPQHFRGKGLVDKGGVGESQELAVAVFGTQPEDVLLAHQRFPAGEDVHVGPKALPLTDDVAEFLIGQVQLVAVFGGPAAGTVEVAGGGGDP